MSSQKAPQPSSESAWYGPPWLAAAAFVVLLLAGNWSSRNHEILRKLLEAGVFSVFPPLGTVTAAAWLGHAVMLLKLAWASIAFLGTGAWLMRAAKLRARNVCEAWALCYGLGTAVWALAFFYLGLAGGLYPKLLLGIIGLGGGIGIWSLYRGVPHDGGEVLSADERKPAGLFLIALLLNLAMLGVFAAMPETFYDALVYHLGLPHLYLLQGAITATPANGFSGSPSTAAMLYGWVLGLDRLGVVAHLLNLSALAWLSLAMVGLGARLGSGAAGLASAALFASIPVASACAFLTGVELWWTLYLLLAVCALLAAFDHEEGETARRNWLLAAGFLLGTAMATKYLAWAAPAGLIAAHWRLSRDRVGRRFSNELALAAAAAAAVILPWILKNIFHYANPIFPFFHEIIAPSAEVMPGWRYIALATNVGTRSPGWQAYLTDYVLAPWRMIYFHQIQAMSLGPTFIAVIPFLALARLSGPLRAARWCAVACWLPMSFLVHYPRFYLPTAALFTVIACVCIWRGYERPIRRGVAVVILLSVTLTMLRFWGWTLPRERWGVFAGTRNIEEFLGRGDAGIYPPPLYPAAAHLANETPRDAKVLVFGDSRGFYIPRDHITGTLGQASIIERLSNASTSAADLKARLSGMGVTHVMVNYGEMFRQKLELRFTPDGKRNLDAFWARYTQKTFQAGPATFHDKEGVKRLAHWVAVYRILSEDEASLPHPADDLFQAFHVSGPTSAPRK